MHPLSLGEHLSSTWNASHEAEKSIHFKECMIQRLCENYMVRQNEVQQYCEVVLKQLRSQRPRNHQGRMSAQIFQPRPKDEIIGSDINRIRIFLNIPNKVCISEEAEIKSTSKT
ncbi:hypothetical protein GQ457_06G016640 [Hibiscus cannabinus]